MEVAANTNDSRSRVRADAARASLPTALLAGRPLTNDEAAVYIGIAPSTLEKRRVTGIDSPRYRQGVRNGAVRYLVPDLDAYQKGREVGSTSDWDTPPARQVHGGR